MPPVRCSLFSPSWELNWLAYPEQNKDLRAQLNPALAHYRSGPEDMCLEGTRITLLVQTMPERTATAPMQAVRTADAAGFAWARNGVGFGLVSAPTEGVSRGFANQLRSRLDEPA